MFLLFSKALEAAERKAKPAMDTMFEDVYKTVPPHLKEQKAHLYSHLARHAGQDIGKD